MAIADTVVACVQLVDMWHLQPLPISLCQTQLVVDLQVRNVAGRLMTIYVYASVACRPRWRSTRHRSTWWRRSRRWTGRELCLCHAVFSLCSSLSVAQWRGNRAQLSWHRCMLHTEQSHYFYCYCYCDCTPTFPLISYSVLVVPVDFGHFKYLLM